MSESTIPPRQAHPAALSGLGVDAEMRLRRGFCRDLMDLAVGTYAWYLGEVTRELA